MIPFADGFGGVERLAGRGVDGRLIQSIEPATPNPVGGSLVVLKLEFGARSPRRAALVGNVVHNAAVPRHRNVIVELQVKPVVLVGCNDVARIVWIGADERAVFSASVSVLDLESAVACSLALCSAAALSSANAAIADTNKAEAARIIEVRYVIAPILALRGSLVNNVIESKIAGLSRVPDTLGHA